MKPALNNVHAKMQFKSKAHTSNWIDVNESSKAVLMKLLVRD